MAALSHAPPSASIRLEDLDFLHASNTNVSNFVSVKLSGDRNYLLWKAQMICLMETHNMHGIVDASFLGPRSGLEIYRQYDNLLKGWIFSSVNEDVLLQIFKLGFAKEVWEKLKSIYDLAPTKSETETQDINAVSADITSAETKSETETQDINGTETQDINAVSAEITSAETNSETETQDINETETQDINAVSAKITSAQTNTKGEDRISINIDLAPTKSETETQDINVVSAEITSAETNTDDYVKEDMKCSLLHIAAIKGNWSEAESILKKDKDVAKVAISGCTVLHIAVGRGHNDFVKNILSYINDEEFVLKKRDSDGSTALHIAAIVGNNYAAELLVKKNKQLLRIPDGKGKEPLHKAYENMNLDTIGYLLKASDEDGASKLQTLSLAVDLVKIISAKQYNLASELVKKFPKFASENDEALMALAKNFPRGLDSWEKLIYPSLDNSWKTIYYSAETLLDMLLLIPKYVIYNFRYRRPAAWIINLIWSFICTVPIILACLFAFMKLFLRIVYFSCLVPYFLLWKGAKSLGGPIKLIENKQKEWDEATKVLDLVCDKIDELPYSGTYNPYYTRPILEAASQNAYKVVDEILFRSPEAIIQSTNKSGYDIIQLAVINRSENIYNFIYDIGERKNRYRTIDDSYQNNILHLAGWLAPSHALNRRTGAALQLQCELQWREEVQKFVFPSYITKENIFNETPDMVFTREHENLVKEGEKWMKTTAESCSITAALITTIVFAAAITVPGGSNQETGIPLFKKEMAFTIFAVSDAISLFASSTALLVFLSILTARFAEKDFLVSLPRRLLIGLFFLLLSTTAMMVAFGATLFLVFCDKKPWMVAPICGLAFIPIAFFVTLQFPLMVDLFCSTHLRIIGKERKSVLRRFIRMTYDWLFVDEAICWCYCHDLLRKYDGLFNQM